MKIENDSRTSNDFNLKPSELFVPLKPSVQHCERSFFNHFFSEKLQWVNKQGLLNTLLDRATGIVSFLRNLKAEACAGRVTSETASKLLKAVGTTGINTGLAVGAIKFMGLSFAIGNFAIGLAGGGALVVLGLLLTKPLVDRGVDVARQLLGDFTTAARDYLKT